MCRSSRREKNCQMCGNVFIPRAPSQKYCCRQCARKAEIESNRKSETKKKNKKSGQHQKAAAEIATKAREAGLSYGQYVAKMGL